MDLPSAGRAVPCDLGKGQRMKKLFGCRRGEKLHGEAPAPGSECHMMCGASYHGPERRRWLRRGFSIREAFSNTPAGEAHRRSGDYGDSRSCPAAAGRPAIFTLTACPPAGDQIFVAP